MDIFYWKSYDVPRINSPMNPMKINLKIILINICKKFFLTQKMINKSLLKKAIFKIVQLELMIKVNNNNKTNST